MVSDAHVAPRAPGAPAVLAVGAMNFGKRTDRAESGRIVARALDAGLTFFDTANVYGDGESERILGAAVAGRHDVRIATKVGLGRARGKAEGLAPETVRSALEQSLRRLGRERVELYYLHAPDPATPIEDTLGELFRLRQEGKIERFGVSNYASWQILEIMGVARARGEAGPAVSQVLYNLLIRQLDVEYASFTRRHPIHTTVYNPLAGGLLAGRHADPAAIPAGSRFDDNRMYQRRYWSPRMFELCQAYAAVAREEGMSLLELSYAWVAGRELCDSILIGPASVAHLDAAIAACARVVSPAGRERVDEIHRAFAGTDATYAR